ncbi:thymidylate synthase (FAD) [Flavonifractor sp. An92]|uniref:FAD-dependent thymidylate synthase n=1 Tax=Flavonifractor sp. An92 TaxID=1965666 RepID=UPI000B39ED6C|nr:FAD-dependent thymidylate synthase [Flavonifractor sp. An92]OUN08370.1 thymidylate synthase (FAD) [Flavonifractor sp. An92]
MKIIEPIVELINPPPYETALKTIEIAGRTCYQSGDKMTDGSAEDFIRRIVERGHESVLEHIGLTARFICDRGVSHEIVRHRIGAYSQESTRYCNYSMDRFDGEITVIDLASGFKYDLNNPRDLAKYQEWMAAMDDAERHYMRMLELGATAEEARSVLPSSLKTAVIVTYDIREWRHFLRLRCDKAAHPQMQQAAHPQMQQAANLAKNPLTQWGPVFFEDLEV